MTPRAAAGSYARETASAVRSTCLVFVGVITSIGYCGFVCGPPLLGALADRTGLAPALLVVAAVMAASLTLAGPEGHPAGRV
ncbi:hypothetical protein [Streptomyces sp. NPDC093260]|uniref:hypothetical protein n=1 Tax=Streptomyces sp. NPDC093260 TaxID=3155073 RepID=UPI00344A255D